MHARDPAGDGTLPHTPSPHHSTHALARRSMPTLSTRATRILNGAALPPQTHNTHQMGPRRPISQPPQPALIPAPNRRIHSICWAHMHPTASTPLRFKHAPATSRCFKSGQPMFIANGLQCGVYSGSQMRCPWSAAGCATLPSAGPIAAPPSRPVANPK